MEQRLPDWLRQPVPGAGLSRLQLLLENEGVASVCREAACPNIGGCFSERQLSFLILGKKCTRHCRFCNISRSRASMSENTEDDAVRVARAAGTLELKHVLVTSVTRDDLDDGGAGVFRRTAEAVNSSRPEAVIEFLIPDFRRARDNLRGIGGPGVRVIGHNLDTVRRLYSLIKPGCDFFYSLFILRQIKKLYPLMVTKSSLMLGMGEDPGEIEEALCLLREAECDILVLGQYLSCGKEYWPVARYATPEEFLRLKKLALSMGFKAVEAAPLARSSYKASLLYKEVCRV